HPLVPSPGAGQRAIGSAVAATETRIVESARFWIRPAGTDRVGEPHLPGNARMDLMLAVEIDAVPVDESFSAPRRRDAHRVVVEQHPVPSTRHSARSVVQTYRDALVGEVAFVADFERGHQARAV